MYTHIYIYITLLQWVRCLLNGSFEEPTCSLTNSLEDFGHCSLARNVQSSPADPVPTQRTLTLDEELEEATCWQVHHGCNEEVQRTALRGQCRKTTDCS